MGRIIHKGLETAFFVNNVRIIIRGFYLDLFVVWLET